MCITSLTAKLFVTTSLLLLNTGLLTHNVNCEFNDTLKYLDYTAWDGRMSAEQEGIWKEEVVA
jgi:hypothetical protein